MRRILLATLALMLAACQTVPTRPGFSKAQVAALTAEGFKPVDDNYAIGFDERVLFEFDKAELSSDAVTVLDRLARVLLGVAIHGAAVEGHTDSTGSSRYNQSLSERRASSVKAQLVSAGMAEAELRAAGLGETHPIAANDTPEGRQQNRRVVLIVTPADAN